MTHKLNIIELDVNTSQLFVHKEHCCIHGQFKLWACANEGTANRLSAALVPRKLKCYQPRGRLHLFSLFQ